jgi:capsular exopolysaccharide synthesis family protein
MEFELRDYLRVIWRRKGVIALAAAVVLAASLASSFLQTPVYSASSEVLLQPRVGDTLFDPNTGQYVDPNRAIATEIRILKSQPVRDAVRAKLGRAPDVSVASAGVTNVIDVTAESTVAKQAADVANAYATAYIDARRKQQVDDLLSASKEVQAKITELQTQVDSATGPQKDTLIAQQSLFKQKLDQLQVDASLKTGGAQLVTSATVPTVPVRPTPVKSALLALSAGLLFGVALAFLVDYLDDSVKTKDDLNRVVPERPVIGLIPLVEGWKADESPKLISIEEPTSAAAEAYRTLRTSIQFLALDRPVRTLHITSPGPQEGKSTTLANLGVALARAGQRVIIVCCDLRRPRIHEFFGLSNDMGFTSVLLGKVPLSAALQKVPGQARLSVMASGPLPPNPSELLSSKRTIDVLTSLQAESDIVLIDSPPVLPVTDALVISGRVDATILVCVSGATTRKDAARAVELLDQVDAPLVGTVLNGVSAANTYGYGGQYYRYESDKQPETVSSPPLPPARLDGRPRPSRPDQQPAEQP